MKTKLKKDIIKFLKEARVDEVKMEKPRGHFGWIDEAGIMHPSDTGSFILTIRGYKR